MKRNAECGFRNAESRGAQPRRGFRALPIRNPQSEFRNGMTLIELLIAIAIIATLSAMFLGASRAAMEQSRASRTKTTISKLHTLLMEQWNSYATRRVDLYQPYVNNVNSVFVDPQTRGNAQADLRLLGLRELMKFEMPDRWSDVDLSLSPVGKTGRESATVFLESVPTLARIYYRRLDQARAKVTDDVIIDNQRAECLYMVVMYACGDGEARTMFSAQDIGDVDGDGLPEFLDGWGKPIEFIRWPAGFWQRSELMTGDSQSDHDPFDPFNRNDVGAIPLATAFPSPLGNYIDVLRGSNIPTGGQVGFRLVPLIYSSGPDGVSDLVIAFEMVTLDPTGPYGLALNPYFPNDENNNYAMGGPSLTDGEDQSLDNIHNHLQEAR